MWLEFAEDGSVLRANGRIVNGSWALSGDELTLTGPASLSQRVKVKLDGDQMTRKAEAAVFKVMYNDSNEDKGRPDAAQAVTRPVTREATSPPPPAITMLDEHSLSRMTAAQPGQAPIVGAWSYKNRNGRTTLERYSPRRFVVLDPIVAQKGTFAIENNKLSVTADGSTMLVPIACGRNTFELEVGGRKMRFLKFE